MLALAIAWQQLRVMVNKNVDSARTQGIQPSLSRDPVVVLSVFEVLCKLAANASWIRNDQTFPASRSMQWSNSTAQS